MQVSFETGLFNDSVRTTKIPKFVLGYRARGYSYISVCAWKRHSHDTTLEYIKYIRWDNIVCAPHTFALRRSGHDAPFPEAGVMSSNKLCHNPKSFIRSRTIEGRKEASTAYICDCSDKIVSPLGETKRQQRLKFSILGCIRVDGFVKENTKSPSIYGASSRKWKVTWAGWFAGGSPIEWMRAVED